jgi:hypothetical protein
MVAPMNEHAQARRGIPLRPDREEYHRANRRSLVRALTAQTLASLRGGKAADIVERSWGDDHVAGLLLRASTTPTSTASFPQAEGLAGLVLIAPSSGALRLFETQLKINLGANATVRIPSVSTPPVAVFVPELSPGPVLQGVLAATALGPTKKILILSALTEELQAASADTAATIIGNILAASAAKSIDAVAFDANAGDDVRPPGLLHGVTPLTATPGGGPGGAISAIAGDLGAMAAAMAAANVDPEDFVIVAAPREATTLRLLAGPHFDNAIFGSTGLPDKTVCAFARGGVASSFEGTPSVETAKGATLHYSDPAGAVVANAPTVSLYQQAHIGIKLRQRGAWCASTPGAVQTISGVNW